MFRGGILLILASFFGLISSFLFSFYLSKSDYGELVSLFSLVSIFTLICSFGLNIYYLSHRDEYFKFKGVIFLTPLFFSFAIGVLFFLLNSDKTQSLAFLSLLLVSVLSIQGILESQIKIDSVRAAFNQLIPPFLKFIIAIFCFLYFAIFASNIKINYIYILFCFFGFLVFIIFFFKNFDTILSFRKLRYKEFKQIKKIIPFWFSSILGGGFSLGAIPAVAFFYGYDYAAYMGVYFIFWSGGNILITAVINNYFWARFCASPAEIRKLEFIRSFFSTILVSLFTIVGVIGFSFLFGDILWEKYLYIKCFLLIISISLFIRPLSAWLGMMILSFESHIAYKACVQTAIIVLMIFLFWLIDLENPLELAWIMVFLEFLYFLGYFIFSISGIRNNLK